VYLERGKKQDGKTCLSVLPVLERECVSCVQVMSNENTAYKSVWASHEFNSCVCLRIIVAENP
jgi:hypothetical protein